MLCNHSIKGWYKEKERPIWRPEWTCAECAAHTNDFKKERILKWICKLLGFPYKDGYNKVVTVYNKGVLPLCIGAGIMFGVSCLHALCTWFPDAHPHITEFLKTAAFRVILGIAAWLIGTFTYNIYKEVTR